MEYIPLNGYDILENVVLIMFI